MKVQIKTKSSTEIISQAVKPLERCVETYRQLNGTSFKKNFNVLIAHYKNATAIKTPSFTKLTSSSSVSV